VRITRHSEQTLSALAAPVAVPASKEDNEDLELCMSLREFCPETSFREALVSGAGGGSGGAGISEFCRSAIISVRSRDLLRVFRCQGRRLFRRRSSALLADFLSCQERRG